MKHCRKTNYEALLGNFRSHSRKTLCRALWGDIIKRFYETLRGFTIWHSGSHPG